MFIGLDTAYDMQELPAYVIVAFVQSWQTGALNPDSIMDIFRRSGVLTQGWTNDEEVRWFDVK